jgi:signal transduction histidine kinase/putative methionine-R-sulfoxide reductase with GAF domain
MEDTSKVHLDKLKRYIMVSAAAVLALVEGFYFFVMKVPLAECVLEWLFKLFVCLVILHVSFRYIIAERKRAEEALKRKLEQLASLSRASQAVTASLELDQVLAEIVSLASQVATSEYAGVVLVDEEGRWSRSAEDLPGVPNIDRRIRDKGFTHWIVHSRQAVVIDDIDEDGTVSPRPSNGGQSPEPDFSEPLGPSASTETLAVSSAESLDKVSERKPSRAIEGPCTANPLVVEAGVKSFVGLPLVARDRLLGVLYLHSLRPGNFRDQLPLLTTFANQAAVAIENARLYQIEQKRAVYSALVNQVAQQAASTLDLDQLLQKVVTAIQQSFHYHHVGLFLLDEVAGDLKMWAIAGGFAAMAPPDHRLALGEGMVGWTAKTGQSLLANDVSQEPRYILGILKEALTKAELCVPFKLADQVIGVLDIQSTQLNAFDEMDLTAMETLTDQLATAIENARLYEKVTKRMMEAALLHRVSSTLMRTFNLERLLENILELLQKAFGYPHCAILLPDEETKELCVKIARGYLQAAGEGPRTKIGREGITDWVAANRIPLNIPDVTQDDRYVKWVEGTRSEMAVPMLVGAQLVGVLDVQSTEVNAFGEDDLRTLSSVAAQAAVAIESARFFREARRRSQEQAILFQASAAVLSTLHVGEVLYEVAKQMTLAIDATSARVCQWNEAERTATVIAEYATPRASQKEQVSDLGTVYSLEDPRTSQILQDRQPLTISLADPEISKDVRTQLEKFGGNTVLYLPLAVRERVIGYVEVWESRRKRHFTQEEINLCQAIGNQAAIAIENARLFATGESSRQKMEAVIQKMTDGLLIVDARSDIILANQRAAELLDIADGDMVGRNLLAVCPYPSLNALVREALDQSLHITRGEISIEETSRYDLGVTIALFIQDGEQVLWYVLLHDITHLKELDRMKSDFVSNVSHDLRTPLANIKLYAALAQKGRPEKHQHYLATIESETKRLEALIEDILDLSQMERGAVELQMEPLLLAEIFQQVAGAHLAAAQAKGIELTWQVPEGLPTLHADRIQLLLMLNNLLGNALQYTPRGGSVRMEARVGEWRGQSALHIAVCDTGIGIPADEQERIFERFYRGRHTPADTTGTGLGLAIVKESIALHDGEVRVESTVGRGSTFTLCFPLETERR